MIRSIRFFNIVLIAQFYFQISIVAAFHDPAIGIGDLKCFRRNEFDRLVTMFLIIVVYDGIARILRCDRNELATVLSKGIHILNLIRCIFSDDQTNHAGADIFLRKDVFLFTGSRFPNSLCPNRILARFYADEQIII